MSNIVVVSSLFPSAVTPNAGIFIRERMFRVARHTRLTVISPQPWFPGQALIRLFKPTYRRAGARREVIDGIKIFRPRFLSFPGVGRRFDAFMMAISIFLLIRKLKTRGECEILDAHFAYPDGAAASLVGRILQLPVFITLRGTEPGHLKRPALRKRLLRGLDCATKVICVSQSLKDLAESEGVSAEKLMVVGNGVDIEKFSPVDRGDAREELGIGKDAPVMITVGGLVERKGFHRVMEVMPALRKDFPELTYLIVGGASAEGDWGDHLRRLAQELDIAEHVRFLGQVAPEQLSVPLSAADVFVLSSRNEGWANVILESMACGTPVVASDVGGNAEVVANSELGTIVPFDERDALEAALRDALLKNWSCENLIEYANKNDWKYRVEQLLLEFDRVRQSFEQHLGKVV